MSYDLFFATPSPPDGVAKRGEDERVFQAYFRGRRNYKFDESEYSTQYGYYNPDTGVYFFFEHFRQDIPVEEVGEPVPNGWGLTRLFFNLNLNRPSFFGFEAFAELKQFCQTFFLLPILPYAIGKHSTHAEKLLGQLAADWEGINQSSLRYLIQVNGYTPLYLQREKAHKWWAYNFEKKKIQGLSKGLVVPKLKLYNDEELVYRVMQIDAVEGMVVPEAELVSMPSQAADASFGLAFYDYADFIALFGDYLRPLTGIEDLSYLPKEYISEVYVQLGSKVPLFIDKTIQGPLEADAIVDFNAENEHVQAEVPHRF